MTAIRLADLLCVACRPRVAAHCTAASPDDLPVGCPDCITAADVATGRQPYSARVLPELGADTAAYLAHHEAGHAVVGTILYGVAPTCLELTGSGANWKGHVDWNAVADRADDAIAVARAGQVAGVEWIRRRMWFTGAVADLIDNAFNASHDSRDIDELCTTWGVTATAGTLLAEAMVEDRWGEVCAVADLLVAAPGGRLDGRVVGEVVGRRTVRR